MLMRTTTAPFERRDGVPRFASSHDCVGQLQQSVWQPLLRVSCLDRAFQPLLKNTDVFAALFACLKQPLAFWILARENVKRHTV